MSSLNSYCRLMRFDKPIGILLLLWPTLWALWIAAQGIPPLKILTIFLLGVIFMRTAGCIVNDIFDRRFDRQVQRTQHRPLATQEIPLHHAILLLLLFCGLSLILVLFLNTFSLALAVIGLLIAVIYPLMKRVTHWPQAWLGLAFAWGIPMAFAAQTNTVPGLAWWLFATTALWIIVYDTFYGMVDRADDIKIGVQSTAVLFGRFDRLIIACLQATVIISLALIGRFLNLGLVFYSGLLIATFLAIYQQYLIRNRDPQACFRAFLNNHWFGCAIFFGIALSLANHSAA